MGETLKYRNTKWDLVKLRDFDLSPPTSNTKKLVQIKHEMV